MKFVDDDDDDDVGSVLVITISADVFGAGDVVDVEWLNPDLTVVVLQ